MDCCCGLLNSFLKCPFKFNMNVDDEVRFTMCPTRNKRILVDKIRLLKAMKRDVERETKSNDASMQLKQEVSAWLQRVDQLCKDVDHVLSTNRDSPSHRCTCCGLCSNYDVGLNIKQSIEIAKNLEEEKRKWEGALFVPKSLIRLTSSLPENVVGIDEMTSEILSFLNNNEVGGDIVGIYGMGGAGKTTLAKKVINELQSAESNCFEKIILVGVSQKYSITNIQEQIANELGCSASLPKPERARAGIISAKLSRMSFLLVLDDVWQKIDLTKIGIPTSNESCKWKVLLTTRDENVCKAMGARKMLPVLLLKESDSWDLFRRTIDKDDIILSEGIHDLAKEMVDKCRGLPLVLVTIARAMATKNRFDEWRHAVDEFKNRPHEIRGMEDVYELLNFSYVNLGSRDHQTFLRYVTLFPKYYNIDIDKIIDYWIGGMAFDSGYQSNIDRLRNRGKAIVSDLIGACLLQKGTFDESVRVHDAIYDMILWQGEFGHPLKILAHAGKDLQEVNVDETWKDVDMVSLTGNRIKKVIVRDNIKQFRSIRVLLIGGNPLHSKHLNRLLDFLPSLRVLDLSYSRNVRKFPESICSLQSLQYLNMSIVRIKTLPIEMENLKNLMYLKLNSVSFIPKGLLSSLSKLQFVSLPQKCLSLSWPLEHQSSFLCSTKTQILKVHIKDLEELPQLKDLDSLVELDNVDDFRNAMESDFFTKHIKQLSMSDVELTTDDVDTISSRMEKLKRLTIARCLNKLHDFFLKGHLASLKDLEIDGGSCLRRIVLNNQILYDNLISLYLSSCPELQDLSCLWQLPNLKVLSLSDCGKIREILLQKSNDQTTNSAPLSSLKKLYLQKMQALERISSSLLPLPSLKWLRIRDCPLLRKLSIEKSRFENIYVACEKEWWESLEWDNGAPQPKDIFYINGS